ncbi:MAG: GDSL-type esterase/lipase family protein [Bryobacteraceae bacterium]
MRGFPIQTALAIAAFAVLLGAASKIVPGTRVPNGAAISEIAEFTPTATPVSPLRPHIVPEAPAPIRIPRVVPASLIDRNGALDHFYHTLWQTERGEPLAITRILHYGDSPTTADLITGDTRQMLQNRFGNSGHGFTLIAKPWAWYEHRGIELSGQGWQMDAGTRWDLRNQMFGLGGVVFSSNSTAYSRVALRDPAQTRLELWFLRQPGGGTVSVVADDAPVGEVSTDAPARTPGFARFNLKSGARVLEFRSRGAVRMFGATLEKARTGVVYDSIGLNGASVQMLALLFNERHWEEELRHRNPDLVVLNYGTNESSFPDFIGHEYEIELREAIRRVRAALPDASILVMSPMDRGETGGGGIQTLPTIPRIVDIQRRVAAELHCGFFNTFQVMGGEGTMARWYDAQPRLVSADLIHPTPAGARIIATAYVKELVAGLNRYKLRQTMHASAAAGGN